ncbi:MAG: hypothetical protein M3Z26_13180 [Bacteroidota bacterium]|nr:hypothetical protein [Bacteroidota bacterium]
MLLKKEIDSILAKHGLKSKGFSINVISVNQQGGQTAYSITNNYYNDPNYISDSINYTIRTVIKDSVKYIYFYPKKGVWTNPFIFYESVAGTKTTSLQGMIKMMNLTFTFGNLKVPFMGISSESPCSANSPIYIILKRNENILIAFGDYSSNTKSYLYEGGVVKCVPLHVDINSN